MCVYKVKYIKECENIMEIEADSEEEAMKKFYQCECIKDYEHQCIGEVVIEIEKT